MTDMEHNRASFYSLDNQIDTSGFVYCWNRRYMSHDQMINVTCLPVLALAFYPITA